MAESVEYETVTVDTLDHITTITINRPEKRNVVSPQTMRELLQAFTQARTDKDTHVVVLTGAGREAFCAGADLSATFVGDNLPSPLEMHHERGALVDIFQAMWNLGKPLIAKVRGFCLAGGFGLALACDFVFASSDALFGTPEIDRGIWPMMISTVLMNAMPPKTALELMMTGRRIDAAEADKIGFLTRLVEPDELDAAITDFASVLASKSPAVMRLGRDAFYKTLDMDRDAALAYLQAMLTVNIQSQDTAEGIQAFLEKREPVWQGK